MRTEEQEFFAFCDFLILECDAFAFILVLMEDTYSTTENENEMFYIRTVSSRL